MKDAQGHGSNPRGYRGKYPDRIHTISGMGRGVARVMTNAGNKFAIHAKNTAGVMPKPGEEMGKYPHAEPLGPSNAQAANVLASGSKSDVAPVHDAMLSPAVQRVRDELNPSDRKMGRGIYAPNHPDSNAYNHPYNPQSVNEAIKNSGRFGGGKIGGREARMIHAVLKGRG